MKRLAIFDVFDTVLTRQVGSPAAVFLFLGRQLAGLGRITVSPETFARARADAEYRALQRAGGPDSHVTLETIYRELQAALLVTGSELEEWIEMERTLEASVLRPVPKARELVRQAREAGSRIVFASDMYLSSAFLEEQLIRNRLFEEGDRCYVSCELGASKHSGRLFREIFAAEGVRPDEAVHHGNSRVADLQGGRRAGVQVVELVDANPNRFEQILEAHGATTGGLTSAMAGASRLARQHVSAGNPKEVALRAVAAGVIAPVLTGYVLWILGRARAHGIERLYFVARDGQLPLRIASSLADRLGTRCELRYLFGSRQAWNLPAITEAFPEELEWMWDPTDELTVRGLLARVGIEPEQLADSLQGLGFPECSWSGNLSHRQLLELRQGLQDDSTMRQLILDCASGARPVLLRYLEQEGLLDSSNWALVDLGWYGSLQTSLAKVLSDHREAPLLGFYFGLRDPLAAPMSGAGEAWFFDEGTRSGFIDILPRFGIYKLLEAFCTADHGTVVSFEKRGRGVSPVLSEPTNRNLLRWGLGVVQDSIDGFTEELLLDPSLVDLDADLRPALAALLEAFWLRPGSTELLAFADCPWEDGLGRQSYTRPLAEPYGWRDVWRVLRTGAVHRHRGSWHEGCLGLSAPLPRAALRATMFVRRTLKLVLKPLGRLRASARGPGSSQSPS